MFYAKQQVTIATVLMLERWKNTHFCPYSVSQLDVCVCVCVCVWYLWLLRDVKAGVSGSDADEPLGWR